MSKVKTYSDEQLELTKALIKKAEFNGNTNSFVTSLDKKHYPDKVTDESIVIHQNFFNNVSGALENAAAEMTRDQHGKDDKFNEGRAHLTLGGATFSSNHELKKTVGEEHYYGVSTTIVDNAHSKEASEWLAEQRTRNEDLAKKLFS